MTAYMVITARITDPEKFANYGAVASKLVAEHGGRYVVMRPEQDTVLEGSIAEDEKIVVSQWPSFEAALAFWNSDEYAEIKKLRENAGHVTVRLVEAAD